MLILTIPAGKNAKKIEGAQKKGYLYGCTWQLIPRMIPLMEEKPEKPLVVRKSENIKIPVGKYDFKKPIVIPANQKASILFDQQYLTTGYPELTVSKGTGAKIRTTYAESGFINALQSPWNEKFEKKDRNEIEGRYFDGTYDVFIADGGTKRHYSPLWMRCWRYIKMDIETGDEELVINNYSGVFSAYPFKQKAIFKTNNPELEKIWNVSWRTARLCAGETYFDCPYYEQLQYVGDTRIQALISLYVTGDDRLMKQAIASSIIQGLTKDLHLADILLKFNRLYLLFLCIGLT